MYSVPHDLRLSMYIPTTTNEKLPVIMYLNHNDDFCLKAFDQPNFHFDCLRLVSELPAMVLLADYRLSPEHRHQ
jgi:acetyl esterase/lipase